MDLSGEERKDMDALLSRIVSTLPPPCRDEQGLEQQPFKMEVNSIQVGREEVH